MALNIVSILNTYGQIGVDVIKQSINRATGKTENSVRYVVKDTQGIKYRLTWYAREFIQLLEKGRRPTDKGPSPDMIESLTEYAKARGMSDPESAAWAIAKTINKEGDKTYRMGGKDVYSQDMTKLIDELTKEVVTAETKFYISELSQTFKTK